MKRAGKHQLDYTSQEGIFKAACSCGWESKWDADHEKVIREGNKHCEDDECSCGDNCKCDKTAYSGETVVSMYNEKDGVLLIARYGNGYVINTTAGREPTDDTFEELEDAVRFCKSLGYTRREDDPYKPKTAQSFDPDGNPGCPDINVCYQTGLWNRCSKPCDAMYQEMLAHFVSWDEFDGDEQAAWRNEIVENFLKRARPQKSARLDLCDYCHMPLTEDEEEYTRDGTTHYTCKDCGHSQAKHAAAPSGDDIHKTTLDNGGGTWDVDDGSPFVGDGFAVADPGFEEEIPLDDFTPARAEQEYDERDDTPDTYFGTWVDTQNTQTKEDDSVFFDVSRVYDDESEARQKGKEYDQKAIFDLGSGKEIRL